LGFFVHNQNQPLTRSEGKLIAILMSCFYVFFTLIPDSHSVTVAYPWVFLWQVGLFCPVVAFLWLLWQGKILWLGHSLDWLIGLVAIAIVISTSFAEFRQQSIWYGCWATCFLTAIYTLNSWLNTPQRRYRFLVRQGYLNIAFILLSLILWISQTLLPELTHIKQLKGLGVNATYDFSVVELRNWAPLGHQNYVAGYLLLAIPLLISLGIIHKGWQRWFWAGGVTLGLIDLYTTSSRGGWLGLIVVFIASVIVLLGFSKLPRLWLVLGSLSILAVLSTLILSNNRFYNLIKAISEGNTDGELSFRLINAVIGWEMGITHLWTGIGLGGVPLLYQKYRPAWAGRESEIVFQLHGTPWQLWAEMGIWGVLLQLGAIACLLYLFYRWVTYQDKAEGTDRVFCWCLYASFLGYGIISLTDYQLDNICISGTLVLFIACLANIGREKVNNLPLSPLPSPYLFWGFFGIAIAIVIWLFPVHRAWQLSSQGFIALNQKDTKTFVDTLTKAHKLAPWESYYSYQLGWNLGDMALETNDPNLIKASIDWFNQGIKASPYQEFGYSNVAWLQLRQNPAAATENFLHAAQLVPAKHGVFAGLGISLLAQGKVDLATEAFSLEILRDPLFLTSPLWRSPQINPIYPLVLSRLENQYNQLLQEQPNNNYFHINRGALFWWQGKLEAAKKDWENYDNPLCKSLLNIDSESTLKQELVQLPSSPFKLLLTAWFKPSQREKLLQQAWVNVKESEIPPQILENFVTSMEKSHSFKEWLMVNNPIIPYRRERSGFGVLSRHIDGVIPTDLYMVLENFAISTWFDSFFPSPRYDVNLDNRLQPWREELFNKISH
jgi:tetratricopeptide (TPR) repeat protein